MQLFYSPLIQEGIHHLDEEESRHALKVLRLQKGDTIRITDGQGNIYVATITSMTKSSCHFSINETIAMPNRKYAIHIGIAPTKNIDRIEWFVEKATELGIEEISFIQCKTSERKIINLERLHKKAISAIKQSGNAWLPKLHPIKPFEEMLILGSDKYIAHVDQSNPFHLKAAKSNGKYLVLIGPEGDFTSEEIELAVKNGFQKVSLGSSTLRTETAGLAACHILNLINE